MKTLSQNIEALYGKKGLSWLDRLPYFLSNIEKRLNITISAPFSNLTFNYTAPCKDHNGVSLVFKCAVPNVGLNNEIAALEFYAGKGAVKLHQSNPDEGWLLLDRCIPGRPLSELENDDKATEHAIHVMQQLWKPANQQQGFKDIEDGLLGLQRLIDSNSTRIPKKLVSHAETITHDLVTSQTEPVLPHGDLHHANILSATRKPWLTIDPKGIIGEREYEIGALLRNPLTLISTYPDFKQLTRRRLSIIVDITGFDRKRLILWAFVQAVLSAWWCIEDGISGADNLIYCAETFYALVREG